jgi:hypothetical protein
VHRIWFRDPNWITITVRGISNHQLASHNPGTGAGCRFWGSGANWLGTKLSGRMCSVGRGPRSGYRSPSSLIASREICAGSRTPV